MLSANGFVQTLNAWNAPTGVLKAIGEFNKVDGFDTTAFAGIMDATTTKHYKMINFGLVIVILYICRRGNLQLKSLTGNDSLMRVHHATEGDEQRRQCV